MIILANEPVSFTFHSVFRKFYTEPSTGASYQILVHLATRFQRRFLEITCGVVAMFVNTSGINEQFYTEPTMDVSYQVLIHLTKRFQRRRFVRNRPFRNKNCLYRPCLLTDQDEINSLYRGLTTYASYQVSVHLA